MKPSDLKTLIADCFNADVERPLYIVGPPGIGKTQLPGQVADEAKVGFKVIHAPLLQPEDYGLPAVSADKKSVEFLVSFDKFPLEGSNCPDRGIFLIDEIAQCGQAEQKILANLILARDLHGKKLKKGWFIVATGNRATDRAGANRLLSHLKSRVTEVKFDVSIADWTDWALKNKVNPAVINYIRYCPADLSDFDSQAEVNADPRGWVSIASQIGTVKPNLELETFSGIVGEGRAAKFLGFLRIYRELPSPDVVVLNPRGVKLPTGETRTQVFYALCGALAHKTTEKNFSRVMEFIERIPGEFQQLYIRDVIKILPEIQTSAPFISWATSPVGVELLSAVS